MEPGEPENKIVKKSTEKTETVISDASFSENKTDESPWLSQHKFPIWWWCLITVFGG